jgi:hypothetical protein
VAIILYEPTSAVVHRLQSAEHVLPQCRERGLLRASLFTEGRGLELECASRVSPSGRKDPAAVFRITCDSARAQAGLTASCSLHTPAAFGGLGLTLIARLAHRQILVRCSTRHYDLGRRPFVWGIR